MVGNPLVSEAIFLAMIAFAGFCLMGAQLNFPGTMVDLFPLHVRGSGSGISMAIGRLGSIVGPLGGGQLIAWNLSQSAFFLLCGILALMTATAVRSEEHTSELQSLMRISYAVFCLTKKNSEYN